MTLEEKALIRMKPDISKLRSAGFEEKNEYFIKTAVFMNGDFLAELRVYKDGRIVGRVIDVAAEEEYLPVGSSARISPYVSLVREKYIEALREHAKPAFFFQPFVSDQANRLARYLYETFGEEPDFPFLEKTGDDITGVFRNPKNRRWYGLVMHIPRSKLTKLHRDDGDFVDVLNIKHDDKSIGELISATPGIYPAWHMQKKHWISVILDDTLPDAAVWGLVCQSRDFTLIGKPKNRTKNPN